jgi:hypothetical protein
MDEIKTTSFISKAVSPYENTYECQQYEDLQINKKKQSEQLIQIDQGSNTHGYYQIYSNEAPIRIDKKEPEKKKATNSNNESKKEEADYGEYDDPNAEYRGAQNINAPRETYNYDIIREPTYRDRSSKKQRRKSMVIEKKSSFPNKGFVLLFVSQLCIILLIGVLIFLTTVHNEKVDKKLENINYP